MSTELPKPLERAMRSAGLLDPRNDNPSLNRWSAASGVHTSTISRFVAGGTSRPANVRKLAEALGVSVSDLYDMVGRPNEAPWSPPAGTERLTPRQRSALSELVLAFIDDREDRKAGESGATSTSPMNQAGASPADDWPHFDPDERTETVTHLRAREQLARSDYGLIADRGPSEGKRQADAADQRGEESQDPEDER